MISEFLSQVFTIVFAVEFHRRYSIRIKTVLEPVFGILDQFITKNPSQEPSSLSKKMQDYLTQTDKK